GRVAQLPHHGIGSFSPTIAGESVSLLHFAQSQKGPSLQMLPGMGSTSKGLVSSARRTFLVGGCLVVLLALTLAPALTHFGMGCAGPLGALSLLPRDGTGQGGLLAKTAAVDLGTLLAAILYASLLSIVVVTVRAARGWLELPPPPFSGTGL